MLPFGGMHGIQLAVVVALGALGCGGGNESLFGGASVEGGTGGLGGGANASVPGSGGSARPWPATGGLGGDGHGGTPPSGGSAGAPYVDGQAGVTGDAGSGDGDAGGSASGGSSGGTGGAVGAPADLDGGVVASGGAPSDPLAPYPAPDCDGFTAYWIPAGECMVVRGRFQIRSPETCDLVGVPTVYTCSIHETDAGLFPDGLVRYFRAEPDRQFVVERMTDCDGECEP